MMLSLEARTVRGTALARLSFSKGFLMNGSRHQSIDDLIRRVRAEYLEMPGLRLTSTQASRLWGLDSLTCQRLLHTLLDAQFLTCTNDGRYSRAESCVDAPTRVKATWVRTR
jgi:hypothetical protein